MAFCKVYFAKFKKMTFFLIVIRFYSQKCIIFAPSFEKRHKITINFLIKQTNFKNYENLSNHCAHKERQTMAK